MRWISSKGCSDHWRAFLCHAVISRLRHRHWQTPGVPLPPEINSILATNPAAGFRALPESFDPTEPAPNKFTTMQRAAHSKPALRKQIFKVCLGAEKSFPRCTKQPQPKSSPAPNTPPQLATRTFAVGPMGLAKAFRPNRPLSVTSTAEMVPACSPGGLDLQPPSVFFKRPAQLVTGPTPRIGRFRKFTPGQPKRHPLLPPQKAPDRNSPDGSFPSSTNLHTRTPSPWIWMH